MRRGAFAEIYAGQAAAVAERLARLRDKEAGRRGAFRARVERAVPPALLAALGLTGEPPWCQVSLPAPEPGLLRVTPEDLRRLPLAGEARPLALDPPARQSLRILQGCSRTAAWPRPSSAGC